MNKVATLLFVSLLVLNCSEKNDPRPELSVEDEIISLVNQHRKNSGLEALQTENVCAREAKKHSINMANGDTEFGHDGFQQRFDLLKQEINIQKMGENVAFGQPGAESVMEAWISSSGHRANIEGDFTHIGVGIAEDAEGRKYYTQIFAKL